MRKFASSLLLGFSLIFTTATVTFEAEAAPRGPRYNPSQRTQVRKAPQRNQESYRKSAPTRRPANAKLVKRRVIKRR
jgi:hypothetical protein